MVYWGDFQSSGVYSPDGGVYYRVDGTAPNRRMTFEWRVQGISYPYGNPGNFQAVLYETPAGKTEYHYGPNSITRCSSRSASRSSGPTSRRAATDGSRRAGRTS